jgi:hypothetical protein
MQAFFLLGLGRKKRWQRIKLYLGVLVFAGTPFKLLATDLPPPVAGGNELPPIVVNGYLSGSDGGQDSIMFGKYLHISETGDKRSSSKKETTPLLHANF